MALRWNSDPSVHQTGASVRTAKGTCIQPCGAPNIQCLIKWEVITTALKRWPPARGAR